VRQRTDRGDMVDISDRAGRVLYTCSVQSVFSTTVHCVLYWIQAEDDVIVT
jgi:hypothetical protein